MAHFGIFCPPLKGHLHPMLSVARRLLRHQHRVTFFQLADVEQYVTGACSGVEFCRIGSREFPLGTLKQSDEHLSQLGGGAALRFSVRRFLPYAKVFLEEASQAVQNARVDILLVDQLEVYGGTIAERLSIPFITTASAMPLNIESGVPPIFTTWTYSRSLLARMRNIAGHIYFSRVTVPARKLVNEYRVPWGLRPLSLKWTRREEAYSKLAQISQLPQCVDYPRRELPEGFHGVGLLMDEGIRGEIPFPWDQLDGRPLIYACLGTLQNGQAPVFRKIAEACDGLDAQLVLSLGGGSLSEDALGPLPGNPVVVKYAPQDQILERAALLITHGSANTTLEALGYGVPMVVIPIAYDQLGMASRVAWHGAGEMVTLKQLSTARLREKVTRVLNEPRYREKAQQMKAQLRSQNAVESACEIIERLVVHEGALGKVAHAVQ